MLRNANRGDVFQGTLTNPNGNKEYLVYVLLQSAQPKMIPIIKNEINRISIHNILVVTRGQQSFKTVLSTFKKKGIH